MICFNFLKPSQRLRHSGRSRGREFDAGLSSSSFFFFSFFPASEECLNKVPATISDMKAV